MTKDEFRVKYKSWRALLTEEERRDKSAVMTKLLLTYLQEASFKCLHIFVSSDKLLEPSTSEIISVLLEKYPTIKLCTSKLVAGDPRQLICEIKTTTQWQLNRWNILEPVETDLVSSNDIDAILIPLLAYDVKGNRVGYGKGYYDELIQWCRPNVKKIGLSFFGPDEEFIPADAWDETLDEVITPDGIIYFKK